MEIVFKVLKVIRSFVIVLLANTAGIVVAGLSGQKQMLVVSGIIVGVTSLGFAVAGLFVKAGRTFHLGTVAVLVWFSSLLVYAVQNQPINFFTWTFSLIPLLVATAVGILIAGIFVNEYSESSNQEKTV